MIDYYIAPNGNKILKNCKSCKISSHNNGTGFTCTNWLYNNGFIQESIRGCEEWNNWVWKDEEYTRFDKSIYTKEIGIKTIFILSLKKNGKPIKERKR